MSLNWTFNKFPNWSFILQYWLEIRLKLLWRIIFAIERIETTIDLRLKQTIACERNTHLWIGWTNYHMYTLWP